MIDIIDNLKNNIVYKKNPPKYVAIEKVTEERTFSGKPEFIEKCTIFRRFKSSKHSIKCDGKIPMGLCEDSVWLFPTEQNSLCFEHNNASVEIYLPFDYESLSEKTELIDSDCELTLYCPFDGEQKRMDAFNLLKYSSWEILDSGVSIPHQSGLRPAWDRTEKEHIPKNLITHKYNPFSSRIIKVPFMPILEQIKEGQRSIKLKVFLGSEELAENTANLLNENIYLNYIFLWNWIVRQNDQKHRPYSLQLNNRKYQSSDSPIMLKVQDSRTQTEYFDINWNIDVDNDFLYSIEIGENNHFDLKFYSENVNYDFLTLYYLVPISWKSEKIKQIKTITIDNQLFLFRDYAPFSSKNNINEKQTRIALLELLKTTHRAITRKDIALLILEFIPKPLSDILNLSNTDTLFGITIETVMYPKEIDDMGKKCAVPITIITLPCKEIDPKTDYSHYILWLEKKIESCCISNISIKIQLTV